MKSFRLRYMQGDAIFASGYQQSLEQVAEAEYDGDAVRGDRDRGSFIAENISTGRLPKILTRKYLAFTKSKKTRQGYVSWTSKRTGEMFCTMNAKTRRPKVTTLIVKTKSKTRSR